MERVGPGPGAPGRHRPSLSLSGGHRSACDRDCPVRTAPIVRSLRQGPAQSGFGPPNMISVQLGLLVETFGGARLSGVGRRVVEVRVGRLGVGLGKCPSILPQDRKFVPFGSLPHADGLGLTTINYNSTFCSAATSHMGLPVFLLRK